MDMKQPYREPEKQPIKPGKFIQIAASGSVLVYALDADGHVWVRCVFRSDDKPWLNRNDKWQFIGDE
jgi:hypothetical protein